MTRGGGKKSRTKNQPQEPAAIRTVAVIGDDGEPLTSTDGRSRLAWNAKKLGKAFTHDGLAAEIAAHLPAPTASPAPEVAPTVAPASPQVERKMMPKTVRPATQLEAAPVLDPVPEPAKAPADKPKARQPKVEANIIAPVEYSPAY